MGGEALIREIHSHLLKVWPDLEIKVLADHYPDTVEFIVVSQAFASMSRKERMETMTAKLKGILGSRFYNGLYAAAALTKEEYEKRAGDLDELSGVQSFTHSEDTAAKPAGL